MLTVLLFFMIYIGVIISIYQVYNTYHKQNLEGDEKRSLTENEALDDLSIKAKEYTAVGSSPGFLQAVEKVFGRGFDHRIVLAAFAGQEKRISAEALLRRKNNIVFDGKIKILHLSFWKTNPPTKDIRAALLTIVLINCLMVLFLSGFSVYAIGYEVSVNYLSWLNNELVSVILIYLLIVITHLVSKFDLYMHDLYQIGKLEDNCA